VTGSSLEWHDCLCGHSLDEHVDSSSYAEHGNEWRRSARAGLLSELRKHGRGPVDLHGCANFFSKVVPDDAGSLQFVANHAVADDWVTLRAELDLLAVFSTAPHPLDPVWAPGGVRAEVVETPPYGADDPSVRFRDESARALEASRAVFA
jgi:uncharacterized protein YcgI (DUF1989 family)